MISSTSTRLHYTTNCQSSTHHGQPRPTGAVQVEQERPGHPGQPSVFHTFHTATFDYAGTRQGNRVVSLGEKSFFDPASKARREALACIQYADSIRYSVFRFDSVLYSVLYSLNSNRYQHKFKSISNQYQSNSISIQSQFKLIKFNNINTDHQRLVQPCRQSAILPGATIAFHSVSFFT